MNPPACIAIFGAGFGALSTVREIFQRNAKVVILPPSDLLHWVARLFKGNYLRKCI